MISFHLGLKRLSAWGAFKEVPIFTVEPLCFLSGRRLLTHKLPCVILVGKAGIR
jgi:hypothetical protein